MSVIRLICDNGTAKNPLPPDSLIDVDAIFLSRRRHKTPGFACNCFYAVGILPLMSHLDGKECSQLWHADDTAACRTFLNIRDWWTETHSFGLGYDL